MFSMLFFTVWPQVVFAVAFAFAAAASTTSKQELEVVVLQL